MLIFLINPIQQLNKARDSQRREDFEQIRTAVDTYYNDYNCYPTSLPFGQEWKVDTTLYMKKVPQDPNCGKAGSLCYTYTVDSNTVCPQWNILFGRLMIVPSANAPACLLQTECLPFNYAASGYNLCNFGGNIDCDVVATVELPEVVSVPESSPNPTLTPTPQNQPTASPTPTATPTPTPTIFVMPTGSVFYCACGSNHQTECSLTNNPPINVQYYFEPQCGNACGQPC